MAESLINIFVRLIYALSVTVLIEWGLSCIFLRSKSDRQIVVLAQCLTNPILNMLLIINYNLELFNPIVVLVVLEISIVFIEAIIYKKSLKEKTKINPLILSILLNIASFSVGQLLNYLLW